VGSENPKQAKEKNSLILAAARKRFDTYGYAKVTMDEIAEDIGMAKPSLYYYFPTKEAIFRSVIQAEQDEFAERTETLLRESASFSEKLVRYVRLRLELMGRLTLLNQIDPRTRKELAPIFLELFDAFGRRELTALQSILDGGMKAGEFRMKDTEKTAVMILHALQGLRLRFVMDKFRSAGRSSGPEDIEAKSLLFIETLLQGIEMRPSQTPERNASHETE
jgi:TetR/AcrR family transcriptional regulator